MNFIRLSRSTSRPDVVYRVGLAVFQGLCHHQHGRSQDFFQGGQIGMQTVYDLSLVVTLKTQVFTVTTNAQNTLQHFQGASAFKTFHFLSKMAPVFVEGGAPVPWHNGQSKSDRLRSTSSPSLIIRRTRLSIIVDWVFPVDVCRVWNGLPQHTTSTPSLSVLRRHLLSMST